MTKDGLIAKQQLEIEHLNARLGWALEDKREIIQNLTCIGGPLNDNILQYSVEQRRPLHQILGIAERGDHEKLEGM